MKNITFENIFTDGCVSGLRYYYSTLSSPLVTCSVGHKQNQNYSLSPANAAPPSPPPYSNGTTDSERLDKTQQITPILSINASASPVFFAMCSMGIALLCRI